MVFRSKKGQVGLVTGLVFGVASLVIAVIIAFVIISTLTDADLLESGRETSTVTNETLAHANATGYSISEIAVNRQTYTMTTAWNVDSGVYNISVPLSNLTLSSAGVLTNATVTAYTNLSISYTYVTQAKEEYSAGLLVGNFTEGIDNVSDKIPTLLLIAAIVLVLGILALLVGVWQSMKIGGGNI